LHVQGTEINGRIGDRDGKSSDDGLVALKTDDETIITGRFLIRKVPFLSLRLNSRTLESPETWTVTEAPYRNCLPAVSRILPATEPLIFCCEYSEAQEQTRVTKSR